jgi:hypothetical protein
VNEIRLTPLSNDIQGCVSKVVVPQLILLSGEGMNVQGRIGRRDDSKGGQVQTDLGNGRSRVHLVPAR